MLMGRKRKTIIQRDKEHMSISNKHTYHICRYVYCTSFKTGLSNSALDHVFQDPSMKSDRVENNQQPTFVHLNQNALGQDSLKRKLSFLLPTLLMLDLYDSIFLFKKKNVIPFEYIIYRY